MNRLLRFALLPVLPFLFWCGSDASDGSPDGDGGQTPGDHSTLPTRSSGCGLSATPSGSSGDKRSAHVGGTTRTYLLFVPSGYDPSRNYPVVIVFHGLGGDGQDMASWITMQDYVDGNAMVVFPDGVGGDWDAEGDTDLKFVDAMLADLSSSLCVNPQRVFALGFSKGAYMVNHLGCQRASTLRAIVAADGGFFDNPPTCGKTAALIYHRKEDENEVIANGEAARDKWLGINGCASTSTSVTAYGLNGLGCVQYNGCSSGTPVVWCLDTANDPWVSDGHDIYQPYRVPMWNWFNSF